MKAALAPLALRPEGVVQLLQPADGGQRLLVQLRLPGHGKCGDMCENSVAGRMVEGGGAREMGVHSSLAKKGAMCPHAEAGLLRQPFLPRPSLWHAVLAERSPALAGGFVQRRFAAQAGEADLGGVGKGFTHTSLGNDSLIRGRCQEQARP